METRWETYKTVRVELIKILASYQEDTINQMVKTANKVRNNELITDEEIFKDYIQQYKEE